MVFAVAWWLVLSSALNAMLDEKFSSLQSHQYANMRVHTSRQAIEFVSAAMQVAEQLMAHDALGAHARDEIGISENANAQPVQAALSSAAAFVVGASIAIGAIRVTFWGALAMALTAGVGRLFGVGA